MARRKVQISSETFLDHAQRRLSPEMGAGELGVSRSTYDRELRRAGGGVRSVVCVPDTINAKPVEIKHDRNNPPSTEPAGAGRAGQ